MQALQPQQTPSRIALITIFNHNYEHHIDRIDAYYKTRFSKRLYIVPFSTSANPLTIPVYENSWTFGGHIAQAAHQYIQEDVDFYVFLADDLVLNPTLTEANLVSALQIGPGSAYLKSIASADALRYRWPWAARASACLLRPGFDYTKSLPPLAQAESKFERLGINNRVPTTKRCKELGFMMSVTRKKLYSLLVILAMAGRPSQYPLAVGYSDFLVVPSAAIRDFARYCGVFSAMNMFAEVAVPTALALACDELQTELRAGEHFMDSDAVRSQQSDLKGVELWGNAIERFEDGFGRSWSRLIAEFPNDYLYVHPVKLSKWN